MRLKDRLIRFMQGRYGSDSLSKFILGVVVVCMLISTFTKGAVHSVLYWGSLLGLVYCYFRMFSKNYSKRYAENQFFLRKTAGIRNYIAKQRNLMAQRKTHHIYTCPGCKQKIRVPKGRGRIEISCPKCHTKFIKRS